MVEKSDVAPGGWWPGMFEPFKAVGEKIASFFAPSADASATGERYEINIELPGVETGDIEVEVHDGRLTVKGEKRFAREEKGKTWFFSERSFGAFQRSFRLPADADAENVSADFTNGVLRILVPKAGPPADKARKIDIRAS